MIRYKFIKKCNKISRRGACNYAGNFQLDQFLFEDKLTK